MGIIYGLQACLPGMRAHGKRGHVMITSSIGGVIPIWGLGPYGITKAGAVMLAEILREEFKGSPLSASVMCPVAVRNNLPDNVNERVPGAWTEAALSQAKPQLEAGLDPVEVGRFTLASANPAYASIYAAQREQYSKIPSNFTGNPKAAGPAILQLTDSENPPVREFFGVFPGHVCPGSTRPGSRLGLIGPHSHQKANG